MRLFMITLASLAIHTIHSMSVVDSELASCARSIVPGNFGLDPPMPPIPNGGTSSAFANVQALLVLMTTLCAAGFVGGVVIRRSSPPP